MTGSCKLCQRDNVQLQRSHFLPSALYRIVRDNKLPNPNPVFVESGRGPKQSPRQITAHLLCADCESRFNEKGEKWVLQNCCRRGSFPLRTMLSAAAPRQTEEGAKLYYAADVAAIDVTSIVFFAMSVFWRAAVHDWKIDLSGKPIPLGPFEKAIRLYLMGEAGFPNDCALWVSLPEGTSFMAFISPYCKKLPECHVFKFVIPGILFNLFLGKRVPLETRAFCFVRGTGNPILVTPVFDYWVKRDVVSMSRPVDG